MFVNRFYKSVQLTPPYFIVRSRAIHAPLIFYIVRSRAIHCASKNDTLALVCIPKPYNAGILFFRNGISLNEE